MDVEIVEFRDDLAKAFADLNYEWIDKYFRIETHDRELLDHPLNEIVIPGGQVFFAVVDDMAVGTCAMVRADATLFELTKMAVAPAFHGKGIANLLMEACIRFAKEKHASRIFLETNSVLQTAISLYRKFGFVETPLDPNSLYSRANVRMELAI